MGSLPSPTPSQAKMGWVCRSSELDPEACRGLQWRPEEPSCVCSHSRVSTMVNGLILPLLCSEEQRLPFHLFWKPQSLQLPAKPYLHWPVSLGPHLPFFSALFTLLLPPWPLLWSLENTGNTQTLDLYFSSRRSRNWHPLSSSRLWSDVIFPYPEPCLKLQFPLLLPQHSVLALLLLISLITFQHNFNLFTIVHSLSLHWKVSPPGQSSLFCFTDISQVPRMGTQLVLVEWMNGLGCPAGLVHWGVEMRLATILKHNQEIPALLLGAGVGSWQFSGVSSPFNFWWEPPPSPPKEGGYVTLKLFLISCTLEGWGNPTGQKSVSHLNFSSFLF